MTEKEICQYSKVRIAHIRENLEYTIKEEPAEVGDIGFVVEIYKTKNHPDGYEVECVLQNGTTKWLATFYKNEITPA